MGTVAMTTGQLACWIPEYQAAKALATLEKELVVLQTVWHDWQNDLKQGDILDIPIIPDLGTADAVALTADLTLNAQTTTRKQIKVDQWNYKAVGVGYREQMQNFPDYLTNVASKCVYSCALAVDTYLGGLFDSFTAGNVGTQGVELDDDVLLKAVENLNAANVPMRDRFLTVDPESMSDLFKIDKFLRDDYVAKGAIESPQGLVGRSRYGCTVFMSNNLEAKGTVYHAAGMYHKEALAAIISKNPLVEYKDWWQHFTKAIVAQVIFGASCLRPASGVCINTRS